MSRCIVFSENRNPLELPRQAEGVPIASTVMEVTEGHTKSPLLEQTDSNTAVDHDWERADKSLNWEHFDLSSVTLPGPEDDDDTQSTLYPADTPFNYPASFPATEATLEPTYYAQPSYSPFYYPAVEPSSEPTYDVEPSYSPFYYPATEPSWEPTYDVEPSYSPFYYPAVEPSWEPTYNVEPSYSPFYYPAVEPSWEPTYNVEPSYSPFYYPATEPSWEPTYYVEPTYFPVSGVAPITDPVDVEPDSDNSPTYSPSNTYFPTGPSSDYPTDVPTEDDYHTHDPTGRPTLKPTINSTLTSTLNTTVSPTVNLTLTPTGNSTAEPTTSNSTTGPTADPTTASPSVFPSVVPSMPPIRNPTTFPSLIPTCAPTKPPSSRPSVTPSMLPSASPTTRQPSVTPTTTLPSAEPTQFPSANPSVSPTASPSANPSPAPTALPSANPSYRPSQDPSASPSTVSPTANPTANPSTDSPTSGPSAVPTSVPSIIPSCCSTAEPTSSPSWEPSQLPSARPSTASPSAGPSREPRASPSSMPTTQPTVSPSSLPSIFPSPSPSAEPTQAPTSIPSCNPSARPSPSPSSEPFARPSVFPTCVPTPKPTGQPTGSPVPKGVTKTSRPTPTPQPTLSPVSQWLARLLSLKSEFSFLSSGSSSIVYGDAQVNGTNVLDRSTRCGGWNSFFSQFEAASISLGLASLTVITTTSLSSGNSAATQWTNCTSGSPLDTLQPFGSSGGSSPASVVCSSAVGQKMTWSLSTCSGSPVLCVNCSSTNPLNAFFPCQQSTNNSCFSGIGLSGNTVASFNKRHSFARLLIATFVTSVPSIVRISGSSTKSSITVSTTLSMPGTIYCMASSGSSAVSVQSIIAANNVGKTGNANTVNVTAVSLTPSTKYAVYCITMSTQGATSSVVTAIANKLVVKTKCCKVISLNLLTSSVFGSTRQNGLATVSTASISSATSLTMVLSALKDGIPHSLFFPANITITRLSPLSQSISFVGADDSGWYNISAKLYGNSSNEYEVAFTNGNSLLVLASTAAPQTPALSYAQMSNDGSLIGVVFNAATDKGAMGSAAISSVNWFQCSLLLRFTGSNVATCQWSADATSITISPNSRYPLNIGDSIHLLPRKLRAACPSGAALSTCQGWSTVANATVTVLTPSSPVKPVAVLTLPSTIGSCDSLTIDFGGSTGSGGRAWTTVNITVTSKASNVSVISSYLSVLSAAGAKSPVSISNSLLQKGCQYAFTIELCNFLGSCSFGSGSVSVLNMIVPYASIVGGPAFSTTANTSLQLTSAAYVAACDGSKSTLNLQYTWSISLLSNTTDTSTALTLISASKDPSKLLLASYRLQALASYSVQLTVTNLASLKASVVTASVIVSAADLVVVIAGGSEQGVRLENNFSVDASGSYDTGMEGGNKAAIGFIWVCYEVSPVYSLACPLTLTSSSLTSSLLTGATSATANNSTSLLTLSIFIGASRSANGQVTLTVLAAAAPVVSMLSSQKTGVVTSAQTVLQGTVSTSVSCEAIWSVHDGSIDLTSASLVAPTKQLVPTSATSETVFSVYLSLIPNSLPLGSTLKFTLGCVSVDTSVASYASTIVVTNSPPSPGSCDVSPTSGTALSTLFVFVASSWIDTDLPLSYDIGFFSPTTNASLTVQSKSQASSGKSILPAGPQSSGNNITALFTVFDSLGAGALDYVSVTVTLPSAGINASHLSSVAATLIGQASGNVDGLKQAISVLSTTLNTVNCSAAPNCTALNRFDCASTAHTCGPCFSSSYVGLSGDSNELCVHISDFNAVSVTGSGSCSKDADCGVWSTCDLITKTCSPLPKGCPSNCSAAYDNGVCAYEVVASQALLTDGKTCTMYDTYCAAVCVCSDGWYGSDCSLTASQIAAKQATTEQLLNGLQEVVSLETLDTQSLAYWTNSLESLMSNTFTVSESASSVAYNITHTMLASCITNELSILSNVDSIASVADNILSASTSDRRRRLSTASNEQSVESLLDKLSAAISGQMVQGQASQNFVLSNYRLIAAALSSTSPNTTISIPRTELESLLDDSPGSSVLVPYLGSSGQVGVASLPKRWLSADNLTSDALRMTANFAASCDTSKSITFSFVHYESESFGLTNSSNITQVTHCVAGEAATILVNCSNGKSVPVHCDGSATHDIVTVCPKEVRQATCALYFGNVTASDPASASYCRVVNSTSRRTICECDLCAAVTSRRKLLSAYDVGGANVVALASTTYLEFGSVMVSASNFNSLTAVKSTALVISTFAVMWIGTILALLMMGAFRYHKQRSQLKLSGGKFPKGSSNSKIAPDMNPQQFSSLEECLRDYLAKLFSSAYSDSADLVRLFQELYHKHRYMSVFAIDFGYQQWMGAYFLLSNRTASFFLLAMFYDIQFPTDDGSCVLLATELSCIAKKSIFNTADTQCVWVPSTEAAASSSGTDGTCIWQAPQFDVYSAVVVSVLVLMVSTPIHFALNMIFKRVMLAPTVAEIESVQANIRTRRSSAISMMQDKQQQQLQAHSIVPAAANVVPGKRLARHAKVFAAVDEMDSSLRLLTVRANKLNSQQSKRSQQAASSSAAYRSYDQFVSQLRLFSSVRQMSYLKGGRRQFGDEFTNMWGSLLVPDDSNSAETTAVQTAVRSELAAVVRDADALIHELKTRPSEEVGVQILELFVRDCLGQHSREAIIFSQKVHPFHSKMVLTWGIKCITFSCLLILNLYFIFACMLYGRDKGLRWQRGWLYTCLVNLFVDIFINQVTIAAVIHYWVPNLIVGKARFIKATLSRSIHEMCKNRNSSNGGTGASDIQTSNKFSASAYFFVSAHVARAFPELLESQIVLANDTSFALSRELRRKFNPQSHTAAVHDQRRQLNHNDKGMLSASSEVLGLWVTSLLLVFGSQSVQVQEIIINLFNPALVSAMAFVGIGVMKASFLGIPIGAIIVMVALMLTGLVIRYWILRYEKDLDQQEEQDEEDEQAQEDATDHKMVGDPVDELHRSGAVIPKTSLSNDHKSQSPLQTEASFKQTRLAVAGRGNEFDNLIGDNNNHDEEEKSAGASLISDRYFRRSHHKMFVDAIGFKQQIVAAIFEDDFDHTDNIVFDDTDTDAGTERGTPDQSQHSEDKENDEEDRYYKERLDRHEREHPDQERSSNSEN
jgi:hypothetical protein